jgi:2-oxoglutarate dehydrogenase E2 component (dihydrolipoamide succinyltransferase)
MAFFEIIMPKLGESVQEARITKWFVKVNDVVEEDTPLLEVATDKVDSEIPSPVSGTVSKVLFKEGDVVAVGKVIAVIALDGQDVIEDESETKSIETKTETKIVNEKIEQKNHIDETEQLSDRFYSPLVKNIAKKEGISFKELDSISGSGLNERVTKKDIFNYIENKTKIDQNSSKEIKSSEESVIKPLPQPPKVKVEIWPGDEIVEMDRMRKMISDHMVLSKQVSPHVTSMVELDITNIVLWRDRIKDEFYKKEKEKITFLPFFLQAIAKGLKEFPQVNSSVDGYNIILRKSINIGVAVALPNGNLIVPVIKKADQLNLVGLTKELNRLAENARNNKLGPDDIYGGTFSVTNFGSFKNVMGTPIINQPQAAIMAIGTIQKKPSVIESPTGDMIAIRHKCYLSLSYDHRVVDGFLGGSFLRKVADYLEEFDVNLKF